MNIFGRQEEYLLPPESVVILIATEYGNLKAKVPELVKVDGVEYTDFMIVEIDYSGGMQVKSYFLGKKAKSKEQILAEEAVLQAEQSVEKAKAALKASQEVLNKLKEK